MSLRSNYLYNLIGTLTGILYPLITFPYAAPRWSYNGATVSVAVCEAVVLVTMFVYGRRFIPVKRWSAHYMNCVMAGVVMLIAMYGIRAIGLNDWQNIVVIPLTGLTVYATILLLKKDFFLVNLIKEVVK